MLARQLREQKVALHFSKTCFILLLLKHQEIDAVTEEQLKEIALVCSWYLC